MTAKNLCLSPELKRAIEQETNAERLSELLNTPENSQDNTPFHLAAQYGRLPVAKFLMKKGASLRLRNFNGNTPLHLAIKHGHLEVVQYLLKRQPDLKELRNAKEETPLHAAVKYGQDRIVDLLFEHDVSLESQDINGLTPFFLAAKMTRLEIMKTLRDKGANSDPLTLASLDQQELGLIERNVQVVQSLCDFQKNSASNTRRWKHMGQEKAPTLLHLAVLSNNLEVTRKILLHGESWDYPYLALIKQKDINPLLRKKDFSAELSWTNNDSETLLHYAAVTDHLEMMQVLVQAGANINQMINGYTPLHRAAQKKHLKIARFLVQAGANVNIRDVNDRTPFYSAVNNNHLEITQLLLEEGASLNTQDVNGNTPLHSLASNHSSIRYSYLEMAKFLVQAGANVDIQNNRGMTALHCATKENFLEMVKILVRAGTNVDIQNNSGMTALQLAASRNNLQIIQVLVQERAKIQANNDHLEATTSIVANRDCVELEFRPNSLISSSNTPLKESVTSESSNKTTNK